MAAFYKFAETDTKALFGIFAEALFIYFAFSHHEILCALFCRRLSFVFAYIL